MTCGCGIIILKSTNVVNPTTKTLEILTIESGRVGGSTNGYPMSVFDVNGVYAGYVIDETEYVTIWNLANNTLPPISFNGISFVTSISSPISSLKGDYIMLDELFQPILDENNNYIYNETPYPF